MVLKIQIQKMLKQIKVYQIVLQNNSHLMSHDNLKSKRMNITKSKWLTENQLVVTSEERERGGRGLRGTKYYG